MLAALIFQLLSVSSLHLPLSNAVYTLCEFVAALSKSFVIGTLLTPPHSSTAALLALSPIIVSSLKATFCFVSILLFVLNDLSTSAFEWHSDKALESSISLQQNQILLGTQAFASPPDIASSGVWENVILPKTPTFEGVSGKLYFIIFLNFANYFCQIFVIVDRW